MRSACAPLVEDDLPVFRGRNARIAGSRHPRRFSLGNGDRWQAEYWCGSGAGSLRLCRQNGGYGSLKVLVIEGADKLTTAAANALLKTLEEPQGDTLIVLISRRPWLLPATIRSRCQSRTLPRLSEATCNSALTQSGVSPESFDGKSSRFLENWLVAAANGTLDLQNEVRSSVTRVLEGKSDGRELTDV